MSESPVHSPRQPLQKVDSHVFLARYKTLFFMALASITPLFPGFPLSLGVCVSVSLSGSHCFVPLANMMTVYRDSYQGIFPE